MFVDVCTSTRADGKPVVATRTRVTAEVYLTSVHVPRMACTVVPKRYVVDHVDVVEMTINTIIARLVLQSCAQSYS